MAEILPALAQRVTVLGSTRNSVATSDGVSSAPEACDSPIGPRGGTGMTMVLSCRSVARPASRAP